jgi:hypothetical protein
MTMDQRGFISLVDTALEDVIFRCIKDDFAATAMVSSQELITFSSPKTVSTQENKKLSIFLYNITKRTTERNIPPSEDGSGKITGNLSSDLHYLIIPLSGSEKDHHMVLEKIIQMFLTKPLIEIAYAEKKIEVVVKVDSHSLDELSRLWMALDAPLRLSLSLTICASELLYTLEKKITDATPVPQTPFIDSNHGIKLCQAVRKTFVEQSAGWKKRNMVVKQWMLQDFQKNSSMTVEEMQNMLSSLGEKLERGESATQFIKPLNQLAGFYQHQLDELKGLLKISHKQIENIETITTWINDVKALVETINI